MRRAAVLVVLITSGAVLSCSDVPVAPRLGSGTVSVFGRITDRDGPPIARVEVAFITETYRPGVPGYYSTETDSDGRYTMNVREGLYSFHVDPNGQGYPSIVRRNIKVGASGATIDHQYTGVRVSGSIVGPNSTALSNARITVGGADVGSATSLSVDGHYSLLIPAGTYDFQLLPADLTSGLPRLRVNGVPVAADTTIDQGLTGFAVRCAVSLQGAPMIGSLVWASREDVEARAFTGLDGVATLYLPSASYTIRAYSSASGVTGPQTKTQSVLGDDLLEFDFSGVRWDLTIRRESDHSPITGARLVVHDATRDERAAATTDPLGAASCIVRPSTAYDMTVTWYEGGYSYREAAVANLSSAADTTFDISVSSPVYP